MLDLLSVPQQRRESIERLAQELRAGRSVALSTHINADGDGCGSDADCCNGVCDSSSGTCGSGGSCLSTGDGCSVDDDCCSGSCDTSDFTCF